MDPGSAPTILRHGFRENRGELQRDRRCARAHIPLLRRADRRRATAGRSRHARRRGHPQARHLRGDVLRVEKTLRIAWDAGDPRTAPAALGERAAQAPRCGSDA